MASPTKILKSAGEWKKVKFDPMFYNDKAFENLISFSELSNYQISDVKHVAAKVTAGCKPDLCSNRLSDKVTSPDSSLKKTNSISAVANSKRKNKIRKNVLKPKQKNHSQLTKTKLNSVLHEKSITTLNSRKDTKVQPTMDSQANRNTPKQVCIMKLSKNQKIKWNRRERKKRKQKCQNLSNIEAKMDVNNETDKQDNSNDSHNILAVQEDVSRTSSHSDMSKWRNLFVPSLVLKALTELQFCDPTPIQALSLPSAIRDRLDILGAAETGSGKTLAFGIPLLHYVLEWKQQQDLKDSSTESDKAATPLLCLVLTPTRELAVQVKNHLIAAAKYTDIQVVAVIGGMAAQKQQRVLKRHPEIVVATPGRLWDLVQLGDPHLKRLDRLKCLVIDEADRMVEKGHFEDLTKLLDIINQDKEKAKRRHTYVFSATLTLEHIPSTPHSTKNPKKHAKNLVPANPLEKLRHRIGMKKNSKVIDLTKKTLTAEMLVESRINCSIIEKDLYLYYISSEFPGRTLVFTNSKDCIRRLVTLFTLLGCHPLPLHSEMHQKQRLKNLERFTANENVLLLATDVAARGLDIADVQHVIHYSVPRSVENYIHRSGRTARLNKEGLSVMFVTPDDTRNYRKIVLQVKKGDDLPAFPFKMSELRRYQDRVDLAKEIDALEHRTQKKKRENDWFKKAAEEMDIELEKHDPLLYNLKPKHELAIKKRLKSMKAELNQLLNQPLANTFSGKYPTQTGCLVNPNQPEEKTDAIHMVKKISNTSNENNTVSLDVRKRKRSPKKFFAKKQRK